MKDAQFSFNINESVGVKLTAKGLRIYFNHYGISDYMGMNAPDADGYAWFQLWHLMSIFGDDVYNGATLPFETTIRLNAQDLEKVVSP